MNVFKDICIATVQKKSSSRGFSLVEILVVLAILAVLAALSVATFVNIGNQQALQTATQDVFSMLLDAKNKTLASENDTTYGVHIDDDAVTLFVGATYVASSSTNVRVPFHAGVTATTSLAGSVTDITFARLVGVPSASGTITLTDKSDTASSTITVYVSGLIETE